MFRKPNWIKPRGEKIIETEKRNSLSRRVRSRRKTRKECVCEREQKVVGRRERRKREEAEQ